MSGRRKMRLWRWMPVPGVVVGAGNALARSLGDMAQEAAVDLDVVPGFLEIAFYIVGLLIVCVGLFRIKKHMDQPQQVGLASAVVAIVIGVAIILLPVVINGIAETFGATGGGSVSRPRL